MVSNGGQQDSERSNDPANSVQKHYGRPAARRSLRHFLVGKGFKTVGTLATLVILARWLETSEYAAYISLKALIEVARPFTSIGATAVLVRFLPELRASGNSRAAYRLLGYGLAIRLVSVLFFIGIALPFLPQIGVAFSLNDWLWLIPWALALGLLDYITYTLSQSMESFLWQKEAQYSLATGNLVSMVIVLVLGLTGHLTVASALLAEGIGLGIALVWLTVGLYGRWEADEDRGEGDAGWLVRNRGRLLRFGAWTFGLNLTTVGYGPGPNRLLVAYNLPAADVAVFGFAGQIANLARRLMPTRMIASMIRPLLLARFASSGDFARLVSMINLVYRINLVILVLPIGALIVGGAPLLNWLTAGKYGDAAPLLAGMLLVLVSEGMRSMLELIVQAVEKNHILAGSNVVQSVSLLLAIPFIAALGPWALVVSNMVGTVMANMVLVVWLARYGYRFTLTWGPVSQVVAYTVAAVSLGVGGKVLVGPSFLGFDAGGELLGVVVFASVLVTLFWMWPPFSKNELHLVGSLVRSGPHSGQ